MWRICNLEKTYYSTWVGKHNVFRLGSLPNHTRNVRRNRKRNQRNRLRHATENHLWQLWTWVLSLWMKLTLIHHACRVTIWIWSHALCLTLTWMVGPWASERKLLTSDRSWSLLHSCPFLPQTILCRSHIKGTSHAKKGIVNRRPRPKRKTKKKKNHRGLWHTVRLTHTAVLWLATTTTNGVWGAATYQRK